VECHERKASDGSFRGLVRFFLGGEASDGASEGTFVVPAFDLALTQILVLARRYTEAMPRLGERLTSGSLSLGDARKLAEYLLIASEAENPDTPKHLRYTLDFGPPRLLSVHFVDHGGRLADAVFGLGV
jgi:hypothetical protein